ncbi:sialic acid-binding Ig-like lectin 16 isoform X2 [Solea solea]|nr:sialic acid-binding Ig-like lectin 16 isoform X2 [Solea solea]
MTGSFMAETEKSLHMRITTERTIQRKFYCGGRRSTDMRMFVLMWATLFSVTIIHAGASEWGKKTCSAEFCITLARKEITAVAGLCVVIPCYFTTPKTFIPNNLVWYKCEPIKRRCSDVETIFQSNMVNTKIPSGFRRRVKLLKPGVRNNCTIIISNLKVSDSGSYQLRVNLLKGYTFAPRTMVSVKGLSQRPTVKISGLKVGQLTYMSCTAPSLCLESDPKIIWIWSGAGKNESHITGNSTDSKFEKQRHSSTLTFHPSAEHHRTNITCKINFTGDVTTEETVTLMVTYVKEVRITEDASVKEGQTLNLRCSVESFPPSLILWTKFSGYDIQSGTENYEQKDAETLQVKESGTATLSIANVTAEDSGLYICRVIHPIDTPKKYVNVTVIYVREPWITGDTTVKKGDVLNLTCSTNSFPPSLISWTKLGLPGTDLHTDTGSATLIIPNVTADHSGRYVCSTKYLDTTMTINADLTVTWFSKIFKASGCKAELDVLTCVCISGGLPLPAIKWPLLRNYTEYSTTVTVSNYTVNSFLILTVKGHQNISVECVSSNENGEARENLNISINPSYKEGQFMTVVKKFPWLQTIVAFLTGIILYVTICCLVQRRHRKKQQSNCILDETLEMVTNQEDPLTYDGQAQEHHQMHSQEEAEYECVERRALQPSGEPTDVEYANIDFSLLERKSPRDAAKNQETTETEYTEIKKVTTHIEDGGKEHEPLEGKEAVMEEDAETKINPDEGEGEGEDMAVYSAVKDTMAEM